MFLVFIITPSYSKIVTSRIALPTKPITLPTVYSLSLVANERTRYKANPIIVNKIVPIGVVLPVSIDDIIAGTELNCKQPNPTQPIISDVFLFNILVFPYIDKELFPCLDVDIISD